nr:methyl-accepting chemotaxis protein [Roseateles albus]
MKVSTRLTLMIGVFCTLLVGIGSLGLFGIWQSNDALKTVYEDRTIPATQLGEINALSLKNRLAINIALIDPTPEIIQQRSADIEANLAKIGKLWDGYMASQITAEEAKLAKDFTDARKKYLQEALMPTLAALRANNAKEAEGLVEQKIRPLAAPVERANEALVKLQIDEARKAFNLAVGRYDAIRITSIMAITGGLLFAALFGFLLARSIARQLGAEPGEAADLARSVAAGDLSAAIDLRQGDTSSLMAQLKEMQTSLAVVVSNVRQNSEAVASASAEIAQGNNDLSQRTEEQASALEQTAASMEQLGANVKQNADNAKLANQLAQSASTVAIKGGEVVGQVVSTMKAINDSSKKIADIIGVIDGIAFQTNILALNAAVEAARAGEQGRGFAVVANEVRSLAGRSAEAAKQIKSLISTSVERVEQGTELVDQAGVTMAEVVGSIKRVTDLMGEISAASAEQSAGVSQVGEAVGQMDQVTQQNAALVEESAAAAESMKLQAQQLVETVAVFKLTQDPIAPSRHQGSPPAGIERSGPDRANSVARPVFGKAQPAPAKVATAVPSVTAPALRTGTNGWKSF